jgi:hypothetical protein
MVKALKIMDYRGILKKTLFKEIPCFNFSDQVRLF